MVNKQFYLFLFFTTAICLDFNKNQGAAAVSARRFFAIDMNANCFRKDGICFQYVSGSFHYFRVPRIYWNDRLKKAKSLGLNTIQTYVPWNFHEVAPGLFDFEGEKDIAEFLNLAQTNELLVILRIGPYIDAEWEHGGIPWWFGKFRNMTIRTSDPIFMKYVRKWWFALFSQVKTMIYNQGNGPVIAFQIENEYGNYYKCDKIYLNDLRKIAQNIFGKDIVLFTTDGYTDEYLQCGTIQSLYKTIDFGIEISPAKAFAQQRKYQKHGPLVNSEYYTGWLDYWGSKHHRKRAQLIASSLNQILRLGASVNLYMFHGGSNFGWMNGADMDGGRFLVSPTSYDYDAPLSEPGDSTDKYFQIREIIAENFKEKIPPVPKNSTKEYYGTVNMSPLFSLTDLLASLSDNFKPKEMVFPETMESLDFAYGFVVYETQLPLMEGDKMFITGEIHDRFIVFIDDKVAFVGKRGRLSTNLRQGSKLSIFIENEGRVAYAEKGVKYLPDRKGILGNVTVNGKILKNWICYHLNDELFINVEAKPNYQSMLGPLLFEGKISIATTEDTFLDMSGWGKGQVFINEYNLGRYWSTRGPQKTLYVPKNVLKRSKNIIRIFETASFEFINRTIQFIDYPKLQ